MRGRSIIQSLLQIIFIFFILVISIGIPINKTTAVEPEPTTIFLPFVSLADPINHYLSVMDLSRFTYFTTQLVQGYGPRHHDKFRVFIDRNCTPGGFSYTNSNLIRSSNYYKNSMESLGYTFTKEYVEDGSGSFNVVVTKIGRLYPDVFIEIGAHIDTKNTTPGASDNGTAVAALMELATILKDYSNLYSMRFISFVGEELHVVNGKEYSLTGSRHHATQIITNNEKIKFALVMDGIGWSEIPDDYMNCIWDNGSIETRRVANLYDIIRTLYGIDINWRLCSPSPKQVSDNVSYWERNLPAVLSIGGLPYEDPNYHACTDDMVAVNLENAFRTTKQNLAVALTLDQEPWDDLAQLNYYQQPNQLWPGVGH